MNKNITVYEYEELLLKENITSQFAFFSHLFFIGFLSKLIINNKINKIPMDIGVIS